MLFSHLLIGGFFIIICDLRLSYATELNNTSSASEELPTDVELEETRRLIQEGDNFVELGPERDIVLLLGITGAGKSTLGLLLSADNRNLTAVESSPRSGKFYIMDTNHRISSSKVLSQTVFPDKMVDKNGTVYYDCPGFIDTRSLAHDVTATHFIRQVIDYAERLKFLLVIGHDFLESRSTFTDLIQHMASYTHNIDAFRDGLALIVTKVKQATYEDDDGNIHAVTDETEIQEIAQYLINAKETIQTILGDQNSSRLFTIQSSKLNSTHISEENYKIFELATQYIDILLQRNGDHYTRIGIFRSPSNAGPLDKNKSIQKNKLDLKNLIDNDLKFTVKNASDFTIFTVSEKARYSIGKSIENLQKRVEQELRNMTGYFNDFYAQQENELTDMFQFRDEIRQHVQTWNNFQNNYGDNVIDFSNQLRATIQQLNVSFCEENLKKLSKQTEYIDMWNSVLLDLEHNYRMQAIIWRYILGPFQKRINETMRWYDRLLELNQLLASYEVQSQRKELVQLYGYNNTNRSKELQPIENAKQLDSDIVQKAIEELSVGIFITRSSLIHDVWDNNMQPLSKSFDPKTNTLRIQCFHLMLSDVTEIINSNEYDGVKNYELFAIDTIFIDVDIILTNNNNLVIIAPVWIVKGSRTINLNGRNAEDHFFQTAPTGDGLPGQAGQSAGNFLGVAFEIRNIKKLKISAIGGHGGDGQVGANGRDGKKGDDSKFHLKFQNALPFSWSTFDGEPGGSGTAGGNGGAGGYGGYCGNVQLVIESPELLASMISISNCGLEGKGANGKNGRGGIGGQRGGKGDTVIYVCFFVFCGEIHRKSNDFYSSNGASRIDDRTNTNNIRYAMHTPAINKAAAVNNYKFILQASLAEPCMRKNSLKIKNLYEKLNDNQEINQFY